jgi:hypothetical protein
MYTTKRILAIIGVLASSTAASLFLAGVIADRTSAQGSKIDPEVRTLWGQPQMQRGPAFTFAPWSGDPRDVLPAATTIHVDLHLDQRRKGLLWYSLYDVTFDGAWTYVHDAKTRGTLAIEHVFPQASAVYDDFQFRIDGRDLAPDLRPDAGTVRTGVAVEPGQTVTLQVHYKTRGLDQWGYCPSGCVVTNLRNFLLTITSDFTDIDYPANTMAPSRHQATGGGWLLTWSFRQILTGQGIGLVTPARLQPGELATTLAASAPVSLLFFFIVLFALSVRYDLDVHPINYWAIASAFFAFHLLFAYSVDHMHVVVAFALASAASIALVMSYLRLVVSPRFAYREAALAQLVYQVGFSVAHFWKGYTGLTIAVLSTLTLYLVMQWTGQTRWSEVLARKPPPFVPRAPAAPGA